MMGLCVTSAKASKKDLVDYLRKAAVSTTGEGLLMGNDISDKVKSVLVKAIPDKAERERKILHLVQELSRFSAGLSSITVNDGFVV
jgi:hypothetical protein